MGGTRSVMTSFMRRASINVMNDSHSFSLLTCKPYGMNRSVMSNKTSSTDVTPTTATHHVVDFLFRFSSRCSEQELSRVVWSSTGHFYAGLCRK